MQKQIIGHRGAPKLARENTLEAFKKALELGVDAVEMDVRMTKDGVLVAFHNPKIAGRAISQSTFSQINKLAARKNFSVPALGEILAVVAGKAQVKIEIKAPGYEDEIMGTALKFLTPDSFSIISFNYKSISKIKSKYPQVRAGLILGFKGRQLIQALNYLSRQKKLSKKLDFIVVHKLLWQAGVEKIIGKNLPIIVWPADKPKFIGNLLKHPRILGLTTNLPDLALKLRDQNQ